MNLLGRIAYCIDYITTAFPTASKTSGREPIHLPTLKTSSVKLNTRITVTGSVWTKRKSPMRNNPAVPTKSRLLSPPMLNHPRRIKSLPLHPLPHSLVLPPPNPNPLPPLLPHPNRLPAPKISPRSSAPMANSCLRRKPTVRDSVSAVIAAKIIHLHANLSPN